MLCGIDEAGRGPIIGPMVMAAVCINDDSELPSGIKDSKLLLPRKREELFSLLSTIRHEVSIISPSVVDEWVFQGKLNWLEAEHTIQLLLRLKPCTAIIDCPSRNITAYHDYIASRVPDTKLIVMHKADLNYKVVSAASIVAKVTRDRIIESMKKSTGVDFGSGYLTDKKTVDFIKSNLSYEFIRRSWKTYTSLKAGNEQKKLL